MCHLCQKHYTSFPRFVTMLQLCKMLQGWQAYGTSLDMFFILPLPVNLWLFKVFDSPKQWNFHLPWRPHTTRCSWLAGFHQRFPSFTSSTSNNPTSYIIPRSSSFPPVDTWHSRSLCTTATLLRQPAKMPTMMAIFIRFIPFCLLHTDTTQSCHMVVIFKKS